MTLTRDRFSLCLTWLILELFSLTTNPAEFRNDSEPNGLIGHSKRYRNAHSSIRRIDAKVEVLDVFADYLDF